MKLDTYEDWKHCITELCKVSLTPDFIARRLEELRDPNEYSTRRFLDCWGQTHLDQVIAWFERADAEIGAASR